MIQLNLNKESHYCQFPLRYHYKIKTDNQKKLNNQDKKNKTQICNVFEQNNQEFKTSFKNNDFNIVKPYFPKLKVKQHITYDNSSFINNFQSQQLEQQFIEKKIICDINEVFKQKKIQNYMKNEKLKPPQKKR